MDYAVATKDFKISKAVCSSYLSLMDQLQPCSMLSSLWDLGCRAASSWDIASPLNPGTRDPALSLHFSSFSLAPLAVPPLSRPKNLLR